MEKHLNAAVARYFPQPAQDTRSCYTFCMANVAKQEEFIYQGKTTYFWTLGEKSKPWLLLIPGYTSTHSDLLPLAHTFHDKYFVIIPDLPGWGKSSELPTNLYIDTYAKYLHALMDSLHTKDFYLVGYCFGAIIGLTYLLNHPSKIKGTVFVSTPYLKGSFINELPFYCAEISKYLPLSMRPLLFLWRNRITATPFRFFHLHLRSWKKKLKIIQTEFKKQSIEQERAVEENWTSLAEFQFKNLQKINRRIHLIHGDGDLLVPLQQAKKFQQLFPEATLDIIPGSGHWIPAEKPQTLGTAITKYL